MNPETQSSFGSAVRGVGVTFREFFEQNANSLKDGWDPVVKTIRSNAAQDTFSGITGFGTLTRFSDGTAVPKGNRFKLFDTVLVNDPYGKQVEVTRMQLMNRDWDSAFNEFKSFTMAGNVTKSKAPGQIFNRAFTAGSGVSGGIKVTTYNDGKSLCSTIHPRVDGGTAQSNASSTGITLTESNFETGRLALLKQLQDDGTPYEGMGVIWVVVPLDLEKTAQIITGSTLRSATTDNDINVYAGGAYQVMSSIWLNDGTNGSATQWFLVAPSISKLVLNMRTDLSMDMNVDRNTKNVLFDVIMDFSVGSYDWHGIFGSKGDGQAFAG